MKDKKKIRMSLLQDKTSYHYCRFELWSISLFKFK